MTTTAQSVIQEVQVTLTDTAGTRWAASELVRHLNDMQRAIVAARPDAGSTSATLTLIAGWAQSLPSTAMALIDITNNSGSGKAAIRQCRREDLDAVLPGWRNASQAGTIKHFIYDPRHPRRFDVYPPAIVSTQVEALVSAYPLDVSAPSGDGKAYSTVSGNIGIPDEFKAALIELILYRAYLKDAKYAANAGLAKMHLDAAVAMVGDQLRAQIGVQPSSEGDQSA